MKKLILFVLLSFWVQNLQAQTIFRSGFEDVGSTVQSYAVIELRSANEGVKATSYTDESNTFELFPTASISPGDFIVAYGGAWQGQELIGEFRLQLAAPNAPQYLNLATTLVAAVSTSKLVTGGTPTERTTNAVDLLIAQGLIDADWRIGSATRIVSGADFVAMEGGVQGLVTSVIDDLADGALNPRWNAIFPFANGGATGLAMDPSLAN
jgi:hypothetical protein